jgi:hypothetical protein
MGNFVCMNPLNSDSGSLASDCDLKNTKAEAIQTVEFQAKILDRDNQLLSIGRVRLYTKQCSGTFWPLVQADVSRIPKQAAILETEDHSFYSLSNFQPCPGEHMAAVNHCQFDYEEVS